MQSTHKKTIQMTATTFQEVEEKIGVENIHICSVCKTLCNEHEFEEKDNFCIFCYKKINQFKKLKVFTFKPCFYFFHKIGIPKSDLELIEYEQMICGTKTDFLEYNINNLVWYIYRDIEGNDSYKKVVELFDFYKNINFLNKNCLKTSIDKFKYMFLKNDNYISVHMTVSELENDRLNFSSFLPRERLFI